MITFEYTVYVLFDDHCHFLFLMSIPLYVMPPLIVILNCWCISSLFKLELQLKQNVGKEGGEKFLLLY